MNEVGKYIIAAVPATMIELVWDKVEPHLQRVVDRAHNEITMDSVKARLVSGNALLVTISQDDEIVAINTMEVRVMESGLRTMYIPITGGGDLDTWMDEFLEIAKAIARDYNCTELRGLAVRRGWLKKLEQHGWENVEMIIRCPVEEIA